jgi:aconitase A
VNSFNRNFPKRADGSANTLSFVTSPDTVMAIALSGRLDFDPTVDTITSADGTEHSMHHVATFFLQRATTPALIPSLPHQQMGAVLLWK